ncbi:type VI secretion system lipoprotein TssJ [Marinospirillum sp.]|uniref:type VI secretion system lipoprotein TssJ n=1 Tax=Marinospirillum sp. TaxID=2183934 RepID=UPI0028702064|nr:type VI secretion system lipoprotein TssJ [Marinospirillum sp.]MDR9467447.1 type VI secretion system lipoprotein TssJ [Marinospirillum sp.]
MGKGLGVLLLAVLLAGCAGRQLEGETWINSIEPQYQDADPQTPWVWEPGPDRWIYQGEADEAPVLEAGKWEYESEAIRLHFRASQDLNQRLGRSHTLAIKLLQMSGQEELDSYRSSSFRLSDLMRADASELDASFLRESRLTLAPGEEQSVVLNRVKNARYLVILAGYYKMSDEASVQVLPLPAVTHRNPPKKPWWRFWQRSDPPPNQPGWLKVWVELGANELGTVNARAL